MKDVSEKTTQEVNMKRDPVCGMSLKEEQVKATSHFEQCTYVFCSDKCKKKFDANPRAYLSESSLGA
jgi:Cu+-exporting ATPase